MMKFRYDEVYNQKICDHEEKMYEENKEFIDTYTEKIGALGYTLVSKLVWWNDEKGMKLTEKRIPFRTGYFSATYCAITKDGATVQDAQGKPIQIYQKMSAITRDGFHHFATLYSNMKELENFLEKMPETLKKEQK